MYDFYEHRGWPPRYTLDGSLGLKGWTGFRKYYPKFPKKDINIFPKRAVTPRKRRGPRYEYHQLKIGDVVYHWEKEIDGKIHIIPSIVVEVEDCYIWARPNVFESNKRYYTYAWITPLKIVNGVWMVSKNKTFSKEIFNNGSGQTLGIDIFLTPDEALGDSFGRRH